MNQSESIKELATAMNKAQSEMSGAKKTANNPFFKSKYADLAEVIQCIKEPFMNNGLSYMQFPISKYDGFSGVETIIMHISGEWISSVLTLPLAKRDPQGAGSAITYARRYSLQSACGLPSEDDDGNAAQPSTTIKPTYQALQPQPKPIASKAAIIKAFEQSTTKEILQAKFDKAEGIAEYKGDSELLCAFNAQMTRLGNV